MLADSVVELSYNAAISSADMPFDVVVDFFRAVERQHRKAEVERHLDIRFHLQMVAVGAETVFVSFLENGEASGIHALLVVAAGQIQLADALLRQIGRTSRPSPF